LIKSTCKNQIYIKDNDTQHTMTSHNYIKKNKHNRITKDTVISINTQTCRGTWHKDIKTHTVSVAL